MLQDETIQAMAQYMTRLSKRQQVVASNLANIDTPGYKTREISFHATMNELLEGSRTGVRTRSPESSGSAGQWVFAPVEPEVVEVRDLPERPDGNNVDLDRELLNLGRTSFGFSLMAQLLRVKFKTLASSINEGRIG